MSPDGRAALPNGAPRSVVARSQLIERIEQGSTGRVTTVVAPPGYGKTVIVRHWAACTPRRRIAYLDLQRDDGDAVRFARLLAESLRGVSVELDGAVAALVDIGGEGLGDEFVDRLVADLAIVGDVVVVLDNFESIRNDVLLADIVRLVERAPATAHFVVASRSDPAIGLSRLRLAGELTEVRVDELRMDAAEAAALLAGIHVTLDEPSIERLVARTEGWPAALQLAAMSMGARPDPAAFVATFSGDDREIADYLTDEVLATRTAAERRFLLETSVLEQVNGALGDELLGDEPLGVHGGQALLQALERSGLPMVRLEGPGGWYRYHPLLRDLLRAELDLTAPLRRPVVLRAAARWHEARDEIAEATAYLVDAQAWDELVEVCRLNGRRCFELGQTTMLRERVLRIPEQVRAASAAAGLTAAILQLLSGHVIAADDELARLAGRVELTPWEATVVDVVRAGMVSWQLPAERAVEIGGRALAGIAELRDDAEPIDILGITAPGSLEVVTLQAVGRACHYLGCFDASRRHLGEAIGRTEGVAVWYMHGLGARALLEATTGNLRDAESFAARLFEFVGDDAAGRRLRGHPAMAEGYLAVAAIARQRDRLDDAGYALAQALPMIRANHRWNVLGLHTVEAVLLAAAEQRFADGIALARQSNTDGRPPSTPWIRARLAAAKARCHLGRGDVAQARRVLAEHRADRQPASPAVDLVVAEVAVAVAGRDIAAARELLAVERTVDDLRGRVELLVWSAIVADVGGRRAAGRDLMAEAVALAEIEELRRPFLDAGSDAIRVLRAQHQLEPTPFLRSIVEREDSAPARPAATADLYEQLSQRELVMLRFLPTRLSNVEIGARLYISTNTVKTHLKHIYRKLGVTSRAEAIERAESLGML